MDKQNKIDEIREGVNDWSIEELEELIETIQSYCDCLKEGL